MENVSSSIDTVPLHTAPPAPRARRRPRSPLHPNAAAALSADERATVTQALAILERRIRRSPHCLNSPALVKQWLCLHYGTLPHEVFGVLLLDAQMRLIDHEHLFRGTLTQTSVYPREVVALALKHNAGGIIAVHCHPSGVAEASRADELLTQNLKSTLALIDVRLLDHFIVAGNATVSLAERGLL